MNDWRPGDDATFGVERVELIRPHGPSNDGRWDVMAFSQGTGYVVEGAYLGNNGMRRADVDRYGRFCGAGTFRFRYMPGPSLLSDR